MRERLTGLVAAVDGGEVAVGDTRSCSSRCSSSACRRPHPRVLGPGGEQAALTTLRRLPRGKTRSESARDVTEALKTLQGSRLGKLSIAAVAPGAFTLTIDADGVDVSVRLDASGARLTSLGAGG